MPKFKRSSPKAKSNYLNEIPKGFSLVMQKYKESITKKDDKPQPYNNNKKDKQAKPKKVTFKIIYLIYIKD